MPDAKLYTNDLERLCAYCSSCIYENYHFVSWQNKAYHTSCYKEFSTIYCCDHCGKDLPAFSDRRKLRSGNATYLLHPECYSEFWKKHEARKRIQERLEHYNKRMFEKKEKHLIVARNARRWRRIFRWIGFLWSF